MINNYITTDRVDIYNTDSHTWSTGNLSLPSDVGGMIAQTVENIVLFANIFDGRVDIYNSTSNTWSVSLASIATTGSGSSVIQSSSSGISLK